MLYQISYPLLLFCALPSLLLWLLACNTLYNPSSVNTVLHNRARSVCELILFLHLTLDQDGQVQECKSPAPLPPVGTTLSFTYIPEYSRVPLWDQADEFCLDCILAWLFPLLYLVFPASFLVSIRSTSLISPLHRNPSLRVCFWETVF